MVKDGYGFTVIGTQDLVREWEWIHDEKVLPFIYGNGSYLFIYKGTMRGNFEKKIITD